MVANSSNLSHDPEMKDTSRPNACMTFNLCLKEISSSIKSL